jgi:hypothetical protein
VGARRRQRREDPEKKNWTHVCGNKYNGFEAPFSEILNAINIYENHSQCFEIYLEKERGPLDLFRVSGHFQHMLGIVLTLITNTPPSALQHRPGMTHTMSLKDVEGLADLAQIPREGDDAAVRKLRQKIARSRPCSDQRVQCAINLVQQAVKNGHESFCFCDRKWVRKNKIRNCWVCKRCYPVDSWHCEACNACVMDKRLPCQGCSGVSIKAGNKTQLPGSKRRAIEQEKSFRMAMEEYHA